MECRRPGTFPRNKLSRFSSILGFVFQPRLGYKHRNSHKTLSLLLHFYLLHRNSSRLILKGQEGGHLCLLTHSLLTRGTFPSCPLLRLTVLVS